MNYMVALLLCAICYPSVVYSKVIEGDVNLSLKEELENEKEFNHLNKPALETIKTPFGDVYDCVDFYKQPGFDHPLLKNHTYHHKMKPTSYPIDINEMKRKRNSITIGLPGKGCPVGTVPIKRTSKEDLMRARLIERSNGSKQSIGGTQYRAVVRTDSQRYNGGRALTSIYNPNIRGSQYSGAQMTVGNGLDSIEVGWMASGDGQTRFFIHTKNNASSCFNACSGFVIVNTEYPLGSILPISKRGGPYYEYSFLIYREATSGRWWLGVGPNYDEIGFWPPEIFDGLKDSASYVEWGGQTGTDPAFSGPSMGAGDIPIGNPLKDAYWRQILIVNLRNELADAINTHGLWDLSKRYFAFEKDLGFDFAKTVMYGGPGP